MVIYLRFTEMNVEKQIESIEHNSDGEIDYDWSNRSVICSKTGQNYDSDHCYQQSR